MVVHVLGFLLKSFASRSCNDGKKKGVMHVQSRCFANLTLFYFFAGLVVVVTCMFGSMADPASYNNVALKSREHLTLQRKSTYRYSAIVLKPQNQNTMECYQSVTNA